MGPWVRGSFGPFVLGLLELMAVCISGLVFVATKCHRVARQLIVARPVVRSVTPSVCLPVHPSVQPSVQPSVRPSVRPFENFLIDGVVSRVSQETTPSGFRD